MKQYYYLDKGLFDIGTIKIIAQMPVKVDPINFGSNVIGWEGSLDEALWEAQKKAGLFTEIDIVQTTLKEIDIVVESIIEAPEPVIEEAEVVVDKIVEEIAEVEITASEPMLFRDIKKTHFSDFNELTWGGLKCFRNQK